MTQTENDISDLPLLYSFRRCPYAMRARWALQLAGIHVVLREVVLRDKPEAMLAISPKGTVPVLRVDSGTVIDESLDVMRWAIDQAPDCGLDSGEDSESLSWLTGLSDHFIPDLNRYKYAPRYGPDTDPMAHRAQASDFLSQMNKAIEDNGGGLLRQSDSFVDLALMPFVRQFSMVDPKWFRAQPWPALYRWLDRHLNSNDFKAIMSKYPQWQPGDAPTIL